MSDPARAFLLVRMLRATNIALSLGAGGIATVDAPATAAFVAAIAFGLYLVSIIVEQGGEAAIRHGREMAEIMATRPREVPTRDLVIPTTWRPAADTRWVLLDDVFPPLHRAGLVTLVVHDPRVYGSARLWVRRLGDRVDHEWTEVRWCEIRRCWTVDLADALRIAHLLLKRGEMRP